MRVQQNPWCIHCGREGMANATECEACALVLAEPIDSWGWEVPPAAPIPCALAGATDPDWHLMPEEAA